MRMAAGLTRIMVVDDEAVFRNHLKAMLDWPAHGFAICAEAGGGLDAVELLKNRDPDIVITDIQMPEMDGLSLIAHMAEQYPHIQTIALSGYDEYKYVRTSMKSGVLDYLLKHQITPGSLLEAVEAARKRIDIRRAEVIAARTQAEQAEIGQSALRRTLLQDLLTQNVRKDDIPRRAHEVDLAVDGGYFVLVAAEIDHMNQYKTLYSDTEWMSVFGNATDLVESIVDAAGGEGERVGLVLPQPESRFAVLFSMPRGFSLLRFYNHVHTCIQNIRIALKKHHNMTACYSVSAHISSCEQIPVQYKKVLSNLENKIYHGTDMVLREEGLPAEPSAAGEVSLRAEDETQLRALVHSGDLAGIERHLGGFFDRCRKAHIGPAQLQIIFVELLSILSRAARQQYMDLHGLIAMEHVYERMRYMTLEEMKQFFLEGCRTIVQQRSPQPHSGGHETTRRAYAYIQQQYMRPISLGDVAQAIDANPSYLSRVFKGDVGKSVVECINDLRIQAAKQLLDEGMRPKEMSAQLGFSSPSYFITVFRQITGQTPMQYKKRKNPES